MKKTLLLCIISVLILSVSACTGEDGWTDIVDGGALPEFINTGAPDVVLPSGYAKNETFGMALLESAAYNPISDGNRINGGFYPLIYEGLFALNNSFSAEPVLSLSYETQDGVTFVFTLRGDVKFSDGSAMTAADAEYSLKLAQKSEKYSARLSKLVSVRATGDFILEIRLSASNYRLPALLDVPVIKNGSGSQRYPAGTGPYYIKEDGEERYLVKNPNWREGETLPQNRIELTVIENADRLLYEFESGAVNLVSADLTGANRINFKGDSEAYDCPSTYMQYIGFNTRREGLASASVRKAIGYAADREFICEGIMARHAVQSALPANPEYTDFDAELDAEYGFSLQKLSSILENEGYTDSDNDGILNFPNNSRKQLVYTLLVNSESSFKVSAANHIAQKLCDVGVSVTVRELKWNDYIKALEKGDFDMYYAEVRMTGDFDPYPVAGSGGALNYGRFSSSDINSKIAAYLGSTESARESAAHDLYTAFLNEAPIIPVLFKNQSVLIHRGTVTGLNPTAQNPFYNISKININVG